MHACWVVMNNKQDKEVGVLFFRKLILSWFYDIASLFDCS